MMTIGELSEKSGLPASTIRYWERIGVLSKPARVSGQRRYTADAIRSLAVLRLAQSCGFQLEEMRLLLHGFEPGIKAPQRWQELAGRKRQEIKEKIAQLLEMQRIVEQVLTCQCVELSECGTQCGTPVQIKLASPAPRPENAR